VAKPSVAVDPSARASSPTAVIEARPTSPPPAAATAAVAPLVTPSAPPTSAPAPQNTSPTAVEEPRLQVQVVVYSDVPAQRMVFIDGRRYAEGDKVDAETVVERITPEGAVVTRRGQRFPLTSGRP
jgi:pyruvate/2-oxoglutarate dehydrogenase complex dihydrolipoamide acyltransferase (E2) component